MQCCDAQDSLPYNESKRVCAIYSSCYFISAFRRRIRERARLRIFCTFGWPVACSYGENEREEERRGGRRDANAHFRGSRRAIGDKQSLD